MKVKVKSLSQVRLFATPWTGSLPGFSIHGILQARILEWIAISFSRGFSRPRDWTWVSCIAGRHFNLWTTRKAPQGTIGGSKNKILKCRLSEDNYFPKVFCSLKEFTTIIFNDFTGQKHSNINCYFINVNLNVWWHMKEQDVLFNCSFRGFIAFQ